MLLKDKLNDALINYEMNFTEKGEDILKKVAEHKKLINCFLKQVILTLKKIFLKRFPMLYDLLLSLLNKEISTIKAAKEQDEI